MSGNRFEETMRASTGLDVSLRPALHALFVRKDADIFETTEGGALFCAHRPPHIWLAADSCLRPSKLDHYLGNPPKQCCVDFKAFKAAIEVTS